MRKQKQSQGKCKRLFVGTDLHKLRWHVTVRTEDAEVFSGGTPGQWEAQRRLIDRYEGKKIQAVYEVGYIGFWMHYRLEEHCTRCVVTPTSLLPIEYGNKVKTDRRDSRKLSHLLAKGLLMDVSVPSAEECSQRQIIRRRRQLIDLSPGGAASQLLSFR